MYLFDFCIFFILVLIQSSIGNSIDNAGSPILLNHAHQEFEHVNATLRTSNRDQDDNVCEAISLQRILGVMMTMLRQDLSEKSKTAYLLETLQELLKNTAANNKEVTDKVDDLFRTLDKYKEPVHENSLRIETDKSSPLRMLIRKPTKPNEKLQLRYELPNLSNSYCTEALVNIAKIASQAYTSLAENPVCNLPEFPDYPTKKDTPISELSDLQLDNPSLTNDPVQNILPAYPSNPIFEDPKLDNLKDFKDVLALYNPINLQNRPGELIPGVHEIPYESNPLYPGDVDQAYNPYSPQSPNPFPFDLNPHKPKDTLNRPKELLPNELNDQEVPYESNPLYLSDVNHDVNQGYNPFSPQSLDTSPFDLYPHKQKHIPNKPEELTPNVHDQEVPYESNPYPADENPAPNPLNNYSPNGKPMPPEDTLLFPWENSQSPLTDFFKPDQDLINPENKVIDIRFNNPNAIDIPLNNPNAPNKYPFNLFGYPETKNPFTPKYVLPQTRPESLEYASLLHPYSPYNDNLTEQVLELPYNTFRPLLNFEINNSHNPSASDTGYNPDAYDIQLNPNKLESDLAPFKNPVNEYESEPYITSPDDASSERDDLFSNEDDKKPEQSPYDFKNPVNEYESEAYISSPDDASSVSDDPFSNDDDEKPEQSPYDFIPKTPSEIVPYDNYITPSNYLEDKDLKVIEFIKTAIDAIGGVIPAIEFDPQTLSVIKNIKNILVNEDKDLEMNDYRVIVELYTKIINYMKQLNGYDQIIDRIDLSPVTNSSKLEANKVVELTYLVKRPEPVIYHPYYYVKYRLPYPSFVNAAQNLLKPKQLRMDPNQYEELLTRSQVVETSPDLKHYKKHDLMGLIVQSGSLINAKLVEEMATLSDHLDALKDITSDLSAEEFLKLTNDASSKLNLLAANSGSNNLFEPINEQSSRFELQENNANSAIKPISPLPQMLKTNQMLEIANSETKLNSNIHPTKDPSADLTTFDSTKLRSTLLRSEHVGLPFSDYLNKENLSHNLYQPSSSDLPEREKMPPVVYRLIEETINTSLRGQNQQHLNSQANIDTEKNSWRTVEDNEQHPTNILNPEFNINTAQSFQGLKQIDNPKASSAFFNQMYTINRPKTLEDVFKPTSGVLNNLGSYHQNIYDGIPVSPEYVEKTITHAGKFNMAQHLYGAPALLDPFDDQYFQPSDFVKQGSDDFDDQIRLKDQQSVAVNHDDIGSSGNGIKPQQIMNHHSYFRNSPESLTQKNFSEPETVLGQKQNMSASNIIRNGQEITNQQNPSLLTSNQHTYTPESNPIFSGSKSISNQQNNEPKGSSEQGITNQQNYPLEKSANPSQENHVQFASDTRNPDPSSPSQQNYLPESNPVISVQRINFEHASYPRNPDQAFPRQQNYLPPGSPVNSGQQNNPQPESHQIWINPVSGQQVITSQQSSGHGTLNQQNIGIYSSSSDSQRAIAHQQHYYKAKDNTQAHSQKNQNVLSTGSYYANPGQHAIQDQQNPRTREMWINAESDQQIIPSKHSNGQGIEMYPSNPSAVQQATVSQQNVYDTNNAMYGQRNYNIRFNAKSYAIPGSIIYKRPIIQRYDYPLVTQYSRSI